MLEFTGRTSGKGIRSNKDITLTLRKDDAVGITVRNDKAQLITRVNGVAQFKFEYAIDGNRLYFRGTSSSKGFGLKSNKNNACKDTRYGQISRKFQTDDFVEFILQYEGDYDLRYDPDVNLYYIEAGMQFHGRND